MNMGTLLRKIFQSDIPTTPESPTRLPDEAELRWAKSKLQAVKRRALDELKIDVDLEHRFRK